MSRLVPELRFKEFSGEWEEKALDKLLEFKNGINANKEQYGSGYKFINVLDILNNEFIIHDKIIGSVNVDETVMKKYLVEYGDILFQRSSETQDEVGTASVYLDEHNTATFGGFVIRGKKIGEYEPIFLNKLLKTNLSRNQITLKSAGSTRYNVGQGILSSVLLPFPSFLEQQKIANCLSSLDNLIEAQNKKVKVLKEHKKGLMQQLFPQEGAKVSELRFDGFSGEWEEKELGKVFDYKNGGSFEKYIVKDGIYNLITLNSIDIDGELKKEHKTISIESGFLKKNNLIMVLSDVAHGNFLGLTAIIPEGNKYILNQRMGSLSLKIKANIEFIRLYININQKYFKLHGHGSSQQNLSKGDILKFNIKIPKDEKEQEKIANCLSSLDSLIEAQNKKIEALKEHKKGLMQQLFVSSED